MLVLHCLKM